MVIFILGRENPRFLTHKHQTQEVCPYAAGGFSDSQFSRLFCLETYWSFRDIFLGDEQKRENRERRGVAICTCIYICTVCIVLYVYIYIYMSYDYNSLYICIYITWSNLISFHIFLESCKLNNGYQRNLIQQFEFRVTQYGNPILNIICKKGRTRSWEEPFRCKKVFGLQHHLCLAQRWNHPGFGKEMSSWLVEGLSPWLTCHSPYISWVIQPTYI